MTQSKVLVVAQSARMLTQMAVDAGFTPLAIDCFADVDTRQLALEVIKVASLSLVDLKPAVETLVRNHHVIQVVYGSGFEHYVESLQFLQNHLTLLGNSPTIFKCFQDKRSFFRQLTALSINFPETVFTPPKNGKDWLLKPMRGEGGTAIMRYTQEQLFIDRGDIYWQRQLHGEAYSILFVASHGRFRIIGFNRQWTTVLDSNRRFVFAGVSNCASVSETHQKQLSAWLAALLNFYPLQGLCSLDFMIDNGRCYVLEINARVPASAQLYGKSIFTLHVQACLGQASGTDFSQPLPCAYQIVYAHQSIVIPIAINWPQWAVDRPDNGAIIGKGQPICSIIAAGKNVREVESLLGNRREFIENLLKTGQ